MRAALAMLVLSTAAAHADKDCPPVKAVALAYADGATADEMLGFEAALLTRVDRRCAAFPATVTACLRTATTAGAARACLDKAPATLRAGLAADAAEAFPYAIAMRLGALDVHGPLPETAPSRALDAVAAFLVANKALVVEVNAFSDDAGGPARRRAESKARADEVRAYLVKAGVAASRVTALGRGVDRPKVGERHLVFVVKSGTVTVPSPTVAGPPPASSGATPAERARRYFQEGSQAYNLGEWDRAIAAFEAAHREVPNAALLYNLGQTYKQKGDKANAILSFEAYLREQPTGGQAAQVQQMIDDLRKQP